MVMHAIAEGVVGTRLMGIGAGITTIVGRLSGPLAKSLGASVYVAGGSIAMVGNAMSIAISAEVGRLSGPLAKTMIAISVSSLGASGHIAGSSITMMSNSWAIIAKASFSSYTAQHCKNGDEFNCHGVDPSSAS